jgi:hypothetical protein
MRPRAFLITLLLLAAALAAPGVILDRIAATVNQQVIAESDVIRYLRVAAFLDRKPVDLSGKARRAAASRMVDQVLMFQEAADTRIPLPSAEDAAKLVDQVKAQYPTPEAYRAALAQYHITEADLSEHLLAGLRASRFTDLRFRPEVEISDQDLHDYYNTLVESWRKAGQTNIPTFEESRAQLTKLLTGQREMQALDQWLAMDRTEAQIQYRPDAFRDETVAGGASEAAAPQGKPEPGSVSP